MPTNDKLHDNRPVFETERLFMRPWREDDAEALYRYASDPRVSELAMWQRHTSVEMSRNVIINYFIPTPDTFAIVLKSSNEPIGCIGLVPQGAEHFQPLDGEREVGYWIGHPHWNKGLTSEALTGLIGYCRDQLGLRSLLITADSKNIASHRVATKCGFSHVTDYLIDTIPSKAFRLNLDCPTTSKP